MVVVTASQMLGTVETSRTRPVFLCAVTGTRNLKRILFHSIEIQQYSQSVTVYTPLTVGLRIILGFSGAPSLQ